MCVHNFSFCPLTRYRIQVSHIKDLEEIFSTDSQEFGGYGILNPTITVEQDRKGCPASVVLDISPLTTIILKVEFES